jgi:hypothetical protein
LTDATLPGRKLIGGEFSSHYYPQKESNNPKPFGVGYEMGFPKITNMIASGELAYLFGGN